MRAFLQFFKHGWTVHKFLILLAVILSSCAKGSRVVPALALVLTATPVFADTSFEATWDVIPGDSSNIDYVLRVEAVVPPVAPTVIQFAGRETVVAGKMSHKFLLSETTITQVGSSVQICATIAAKDKVTGKESPATYPTPCIFVDTTPPAPSTPGGFTFSASPAP